MVRPQPSSISIPRAWSYPVRRTRRSFAVCWPAAASARRVARSPGSSSTPTPILPGRSSATRRLPTGVSQTGLAEGTIVGMTEADADYISPVYSAFTDFGTPAAAGTATTPATPAGPALAACRDPTASCSSDRVSRPRRPRSRSTRPGPSARICAVSRTSLSTITAISLRTFRSPRPPPPAPRPPSPPLQPSRSPFRPCPPATCS